MEPISEQFLTKLREDQEDLHPGDFSSLNLAYLGDAVFELCTRVKVLDGRRPVHKLHTAAKAYVSAVAQARMYKQLLAAATQEEVDVLRRGRNAKSFTTPKNTSVAEYRHATGVEALFGYLFVTGRIERLMELFALCTEESAE